MKIRATAPANAAAKWSPIYAEPDARRGYIITHRCVKCGAIKRCRTAHEAKVQPDDLELIIALTAKSGVSGNNIK